MKNFKKGLALFLVALIAAAVCACSKEEETIATDANGNYVPTKELKLTIWETQGTDYTPQQEPDEDIVEQWLEGQTKVSIENIYGNDGGQWDTKLSRLIAGDNLPHILHCGGYQGPAHFAKLAEIDKVWELTPEMLQKYAPNVWNRVPQELWERMKVNGKIYGIPYGLETTKTTQPNMTDEDIEMAKEYLTAVIDDTSGYLWIRDDIAQQLFPEAKSWDELCEILETTGKPIGEELLDIPLYSTEDYVKMLRDIKNLGLEENGKTVYAFGYTGGDNWVGLSWLGGDMMGYKTHNYSGSWNPVTQEMRISLLEPIVKEAASIQNELIREKVIDPESLVHTMTLFKEKVMNGQYAIAPLTYVGNPSDINKQLEEAGKSFRFRPLYSQVPAAEGYDAFREPQLWTNSIALLKTLSESELIQTLNWINTQFSDEFEEIIWWGPEEAGLYTENADGTRRYTDEQFNAQYIDNGASTLDAKTCKGIGNLDTSSFFMLAGDVTINRWNPSIYNKSFKLLPSNSRSYGFSVNSEHVTNVKLFPPCQVWSPEYAAIPEVIEFWSNREQWEAPFKVAMSSDSEETFNQKWEEAVANVKNITDINAMTAAMTEIARQEAAKLQ